MRLSVISVAMAFPLFSACTTSTPCYFPEATELAPSWVCGEPVEGYPLTAVGVAENHSGRMSPSFLIDLAASKARVNLLRQKKGSNVEATVETSGTSVKETVEGTVKTKTLRFANAPNGNVYVLITDVE